jgi:uncharacterized protein
VDRLFVDTNVFLRFITRDDLDKAARARELFQSAVDGKVALEISLLVVAEIVWTLESFYQLDRKEISAKVALILNTPNLHCQDSDLVLQALDSYVAKNVDFADAYHAALLRERGPTKIATYDRKHFSRFAGLQIVDL